MLAHIEDGIGDTLILPNREDRKDSYLGFNGDSIPIALGNSANQVKGIEDEESTSGEVMIWADGTGSSAGDSHRIFGSLNGATTLDSNDKIPQNQSAIALQIHDQRRGNRP
jgi:hypothetical protein